MYPDGYAYYLIQFKNAKKEKVSALRFETEEKIYLLRMTQRMAEKIMEEDGDFDDNYNLKPKVKEILMNKHADVEQYAENEDYDIN